MFQIASIIRKKQSNLPAFIPATQTFTVPIQLLHNQTLPLLVCLCDCNAVNQ